MFTWGQAGGQGQMNALAPGGMNGLRQIGGMFSNIRDNMNQRHDARMDFAQARQDYGDTRPTFDPATMDPAAFKGQMHDWRQGRPQWQSYYQNWTPGPVATPGGAGTGAPLQGTMPVQPAPLPTPQAPPSGQLPTYPVG